MNSTTCEDAKDSSQAPMPQTVPRNYLLIDMKGGA